MSSRPSSRGKRLSLVASKHLTFALGNEVYAVPALKVREIIRMMAITAIPRLPDYVRGVINLRGKVMPVIDLRVRFGLPAAEPTSQTSIVVMQVSSPAGLPVFVGLVVDAVEEVVDISREEIEEAAVFGRRIEPACILGMARIRGVTKTLLDIDRILSAEMVIFTGLQTGALPPPPGGRLTVE